MVAEDEDNIAFLDINPLSVGHTLVIPKAHFEKLDETRFLGREFLTWLWYRSETEPAFGVEDMGAVNVALGNRIELSDDPTGAGETVTITGEAQALREARVALREGKMVSSAKWSISLDGHEWSVTLDDLWLYPRSFKPPKVENDDEEPDPEGLLLERVYLVEQGIRAIDALLKEFITLRTSGRWEQNELPALRQWIETGTGG